jgi:hypothetical protein
MFSIRCSSNCINTILQNNNYPPNVDINTKKKQNKHTTQYNSKEEWAIFTYVRTETRAITRLFKHTNLRIALKPNNTIQNHLQPKKPNSDKYNNSGIYHMKWNDCHKKYVGQTGRKFKTRYQQHIHYIRTNNTNSKYAEHILYTQHTYGPRPYNRYNVYTTYWKERPFDEYMGEILHTQAQQK